MVYGLAKKRDTICKDLDMVSTVVLVVTLAVVFIPLDMAVLKIEEVKKGHEGVYKCVSQNFDNEIKYNNVEVRVIETGMCIYVMPYVCMYV